MTDAQLTILVSALVAIGGVIGTAIKWAVGRMVKSSDASTEALIANTASNAVLSVKVDAMCTKLDNVSDWMESATPIGNVPTPRQPHRGNTPAHGSPTAYSIPRRARTRGEDE